MSFASVMYSLIAIVDMISCALDVKQYRKEHDKGKIVFAMMSFASTILMLLCIWSEKKEQTEE